MTIIQYEELHKQLSFIKDFCETILNKVEAMEATVKELTDKTLIISDVNKQLDELRNDVDALIDEQEEN